MIKDIDIPDFQQWFNEQTSNITSIDPYVTYRVLFKAAIKVWDRDDNGEFIPRRRNGKIWIAENGYDNISVAEWALGQYPYLFSED